MKVRDILESRYYQRISLEKATEAYKHTYKNQSSDIVKMVGVNTSGSEEHRVYAHLMINSVIEHVQSLVEEFVRRNNLPVTDISRPSEMDVMKYRVMISWEQHSES